MAYSASTTRATGFHVTAAVWNQDVVDNVAFLANPPACRVFASAAVSIVTSGVGQAVTYNSELYDTDSMHSTSSLTDRLTINTAGVYLVTGQIQYASNATGVRALDILRNGGGAITSDLRPAVSGFPTRLVLATAYKLVAGDYLQLSAYQTSGAALNAEASEFAATWIGLG